MQGYTPLSEGLWPWLENLILPAIALGCVYIALIARITRATMLEVLSQDYVRTARAPKAGPEGILFIHALKNAAVPIVTVIGIGIALLIGGAVVTESVFASGARPADDRRDPAARLSGHPGRRAAVQLRLRAREPRGRPPLHAHRSEDPLLNAPVTRRPRRRPRGRAGPPRHLSRCEAAGRVWASCAGIPRSPPAARSSCSCF